MSDGGCEASTTAHILFNFAFYPVDEFWWRRVLIPLIFRPNACAQRLKGEIIKFDTCSSLVGRETMARW